jgi:hypothetical protein
LFAIRYKPDGLDELERLFDDWQDVVYLEEFFEKHQEDLKSGFFDPVPSVEDAVLITRSEAKRLEKLLKKTLNSANPTLHDLFVPLTQNEQSTIPFPRQKSYGDRKKSWLRIYAIRIDDCYLITGGAIKLTGRMDDRDHTNIELSKMNKCLEFFKEQGIEDIQGFIELSLE